MSNSTVPKPYHYSSYQSMYQTSNNNMQIGTLGSIAVKPQKNNNICKCNKFLPQLFNANKCQQCFNLKDMHSLEALAEFSKANRKVCKYSYLFIAPPDLELNKTKRWQWRFFIFHDDGELTYSLDENPLTLPQGRINMCKCEELIELNTNINNKVPTNDSMGLVSYPNSLRLRFAAPNKDIYIAAGNFEEMCKWKDILSLYCKRILHKTESTPSKCVSNDKDKKSNNKLYTSNNKPINLDDFDHIDDIDNIDDDIDEIDLKNNDEDYDEEYDEELDDQDDYAYDENDFTSLRIKNSTNLAKNNDYFYPNSNSNSNNNYQSKTQTLSSSSSNSSSSNLNRKRNENLKIKMMCGIKKSKSKIKLQQNPSSSNINNTEPQILPKEDEKDTNSSNDTSINNEVGVVVNSSNISSTSNNNNGNRRLSYKEDDLLRKQRLKDNLNQLLLEYKHEEEQHLKKSTKFNSLNDNKVGTKRVSLDSSISNNKNITGQPGYNKSSAFSLVVPPNQLLNPNNHHHHHHYHYHNSAFKPINSVQNSSIVKNINGTNKTDPMPIKIQANKAKSLGSSSIINTVGSIASKEQGLALETKETKTSSSNIETSSSSQSSWTSTSSSSSSSSSTSSSKSPPKTRSSTISVLTNEEIKKQGQSYKKPCLISPRKSKNDEFVNELTQSGSLASNNGLKIHVTRQNQEIEKQQRSDFCNPLPTSEKQQISPQDRSSTQSLGRTPKNSFGTLGSNVSGYLWKLIDNSCHNGLSQLTKEIDNNKFEKLWFSLNSSLCCLIYWGDKYEQDLGKFPFGKYELTKCCQVIIENNESSLELKISFHQNQSMITLKAISIDKKIEWFDALKHNIDSQTIVCSKCKPKLIVNPMQLGTPNNSSNSNILPKSEEVKSQKLNSKSSKKLSKSNQNVNSDLTESSSSSLSPSILISSSSLAVNNILSQKIPNQTELENIRIKHEKLEKETIETTRKFILLEKIHLDAVNEFDKEQSRLYNQLEEMTIKLNQSDLNQESFNKKFKEKNEASTEQIRLLNEQILRFKDKCKQQDSEIDALNKRINGFNSLIISQSQDSNVQPGWNKEVKNLDARISDVLGKLREREIILQSPSNNNTSNSSEISISSKNYEKIQLQLYEAQQKITSLTSQLNTLEKPHIQDFGDDLAKVLMSKEEVITSLEKQLKDKDKNLNILTEKLAEEISGANRYQNALDSVHAENMELTNDIKTQKLELDSLYSKELEILNEKLNEMKLEVESVQKKMEISLISNEELSLEMKNSNELLESAQEEIKTLEYKLVHSQRQAHEYQSMLEDMDLTNSNTLNFMQQFNMRNDLNTQIQLLCNDNLEKNNLPINSSSIQFKLKRNQYQVQLLNQQILVKKMKDFKELNEQLEKNLIELNELKEENVELNDHIYSIDVFMREKDQQCDQYQNEKVILSNKLEEKIRELQNFNNKDNINLNGNELSKENIKILRSSLKKLINFVSSSELMQFNSQIVSYMAEQLVHKSALNGNLNFACDILRKKTQETINKSEKNNSLLIECQNLNGINSSELSSPKSSKQDLPGNNIQDEKIFKLASELLLSDENSLRKLSAQVLNEAQHLTQLNCILNNLRKIRWKHLKLRSKGKLDQTLNDISSIQKLDENEEDVEDQEDSELFENDSDDGQENIEKNIKLEEEKLDYILNIIKSVFEQHKTQVSEQLNEVQKIMSISSDNDLLTHLQTENSILQQELQKFQSKSLNNDKKASSNSNWLSGTTNNSPSSSSSYSTNNIISGATSTLRKFNSSVLPLRKSSPTLIVQQNEKPHQHILTDMQTQEDTAC